MTYSNGILGIPRGLLYYYYYPFFSVFFNSLGFNVVSSPKTTKGILDLGIRYSVPEVCIPIKIYLGHVKYLIDKGVDYILVPRFVRIRDGEWFCPKFLGLPDMVRYLIPGAADKILDIDINTKGDSLNKLENFKPLQTKFNISTSDLKNALNQGVGQWREFKEKCHQGNTVLDIIEGNWRKLNTNSLDRKSGIKIGLLGYVYNLYDNYSSMNIIQKFRELNVDIITFEMIPEGDIYKPIDSYSKQMFWSFTNKLWGAGLRFFKDKTIDGIIHVTAFGCGPDALLGKLLELESIDYKKPFLTIRVDEHSGENHLLTRLEAFVDMIKRKKFAEILRKES